MMLDSRCRSLDELPCDGSNPLMWFVYDSDHVAGPGRTSDRQQAGVDSVETERCLSTSDLLTAGDTLCCQQGDEYDPSWCSVNNLETDCVSPRVSSNSLFSQVEVGTGTSSDEVGEHVPSSSSYRLTATDVAQTGRWTPSGDEQPMYTRHSRRTPLHRTVGQQAPLPTTSVLRTVAARGVPWQVIVGYDERRSSMAAANRSASCPSLLQEHLSRPTTHQQPHPADQIPSKTDDNVDKLLVDGVLAPIGLVTHTTGSGSRSPMQCLTAKPNRASPPTSTVPDTSVRDVRRLADDGGRKTRQRGGGSSSAMTAGRATRRLARTKCLQWLNSFDEDD